MAEFAQGLGFDLADTFTSDIELLAHFFQGMVGVHLDAEAHAQHLGLTPVSYTHLTLPTILRV